MRNDVITLITNYTQGSEVSKNEVEVFAEKKSVTRTEFYGAYQVGLNPKHIFVVDSLDFELTRKVKDEEEIYAQQIKYNGAVFTIIRSYDNGIEIELTVG